MKNVWRAIALPSVRKKDIEIALNSSNLDWQSIGHIAATSSLSKSLRGTSCNAHNVGQLIEMLVFSSMPKPYLLNLTDFPDAKLMSQNCEEYENQESNWRAIVSGRQMKIGLEFNQIFRDFLSESGLNGEIRNILRREKKSIRQGIQTLLAGGFNSGNIQDETPNNSANPITSAVKEAWEYLDANFAPINVYRDFLWINEDEYISQETPRSRAVKKILLTTLEIAFGKTNGRRTLIHHGFYFYTPPQWALFQLMRNTEGIDQIFIIHDDGFNPAFETWRKFFKTDWRMPEIEYLNSKSEVTYQATAFSEILTGGSPSFGKLSKEISVLKCRTPADFTRHWILAKELGGDRKPQLFAALPEEVERFVELEFDSGVISASNLAYLPVGVFLLGIHRSIDMSNIDDIQISIKGPTLIDIASTNFIETGIDDSILVQTLNKVLPYFSDCVSPHDWRARLKMLKEDVFPTMNAMGAKKEEDSDVDRITKLVGNPLRLAIWIDLSEKELKYLEIFLNLTIDLIEQIANSQSRNLKSYLDFIGSKLEAGLRNENARIQKEILNKISGFSIGTSNKYDIDGLIEVVEILLGQQAEFSGIGEDILNFTAKPLRALDSLGLIRSGGDVLVANLSDGAFPSKHQSLPWPFNLDLLTGNYEVISREILRARGDYSTLSDLYLLWLALDGVEDGSKIILSWIAELPTEVRELSSLIKLILQPERLTRPVGVNVGGLEVLNTSGNLNVDATRVAGVPYKVIETKPPIQIAADLINPIALSSSLICDRRFAIQWAVGPSPGFQSEHIHRMLYGNFQTILFEKYKLAWEESEDFREKLWIFMSPGQRASSFAKRRIKKTGAAIAWIFTLSGSKGSSKSRGKSSVFDLAYQIALGINPPPSATELMDTQARFLPEGAMEYKICNMCPVKPRCGHAVTQRN